MLKVYAEIRSYTKVLGILPALKLKKLEFLRFISKNNEKMVVVSGVMVTESLKRRNAINFKDMDISVLLFS